MRRYSGSINIPSFKNAVVAIGNFDGVHLGHQRLIKKAIGIAKKINGTSVIYTFEPHPAKIFAAETSPPLIQTLDQKLDSLGSVTLAELKVDACIVEKFTPTFAKLTPKMFCEKILSKRLGAKVVVVGYDFTFGFKRSGSVEELKRLCSELSIETVVIKAQFLKGELISSTKIRQLVLSGMVDKAALMLGRPFQIEGKVIKGVGMGGLLGIHTANIKPENELIPAEGVYITKTSIGERTFKSVTSIGHNPTFHARSFSIETHIINFNKNIMEKRIKIDMLKKMRDQVAFPTAKMLKEEMEKDIQKAKRWQR